MPRETDAAESLGEGGSPEADRHLAENFGMTVRQVREFDPQTLDVTRACKFLGLPLKRFDSLAGQPEARDRWVGSVARERKELIETFPHAGKEIKEMLEAIRKFALRKCLKPDSPALVDGGGRGADKLSPQWPPRTLLLVVGVTLMVILLGGVAVAVLVSASGGPERQAAKDTGDVHRQEPARFDSREAEGPAAKPAVVPEPARPSPAPPKTEKWVSLFDGETLRGWKTLPAQPRGWSVENGLLVGRSEGTHVATHLFSEDSEFEDFHLRVEGRINKFGNSGVYFRSTSDLSRMGRFPTGYEAQILHSHPRPGVPLTGSLFGLASVTKQMVEPNEWFTMEVIAQGQRIVVKVNGTVATDFVDRAATFTRGHLALQALSEGKPLMHTVVQFRKIDVMKFPGR